MPKDNTEDLFDNVRLPKEKSAEPAPQPAAPMREAAPVQAPQRAGAPLSRLLWLVVPLLAAVAAVALWTVSWWLVLVAAGALVVGLALTAAARHWQRRRTGNLSRPGHTGLWPSRPGGRTGLGRIGSSRGGLGRSGSGRTGRGLGSLGSKRGTGTGIGRGTGSGRTGRGLFKRGPGKSGRASTGAAPAGRTGRARTSGRPVRGGRLGALLSPGRRSARGGAAQTGTGRSGAGGTGTSRRTGRGARSGAAGGTGLRGGAWTTSRANPKTWVGNRRRAAQAVRAATKNRRRGRDDEARRPRAGRTEDVTVKRPFWKTWRAKSYTKGGEPIGDAKPTAAGKGPAKKPGIKKATVKPQNENGGKGADAAAPSGTSSKPKAAPKPRQRPTLDDILVDEDYGDVGFPDWQRPKPVPAREFDFEGQGFPSSAPSTKHQARPADYRKRRSIMTNRTTNPAATQIDASTPETWRATNLAVAEDLRRSAGKLQEDAAELRRQAQVWTENGEEATAVRLRGEAAALDVDAGKRVASAAAYEDAAAAAK